MEHRTPVLGILAAIATPLLLLGFPSVPEPPHREAVPPPPALEELELLEELALWIGEPGVFPTAGVAVADLAQTLRARGAGFEIFRQFNGRDEHREVLSRLPYGRLIQTVAEESGLDGLLLAAIVRSESRFDPQAVSHRGAMGLMQLMPATAAMYGVTDAFDPAANVRAGARYLRSLLDLYEGDVELALAAYNAGPGTVARFGGMPPYRETQSYVGKVLSSYVSYHRRLWDDSELLVLLRTVSRPYEGEAETAAVGPESPLSATEGVGL